MVPPAIMTALHSFSTWAKWTAGFNSRNLTLLSDKVPGQKRITRFFFKIYDTSYHLIFANTFLNLEFCLRIDYLACAPLLFRPCCC